MLQPVEELAEGNGIFNLCKPESGNEIQVPVLRPPHPHHPTTLPPHLHPLPQGFIPAALRHVDAVEEIWEAHT